MSCSVCVEDYTKLQRKCIECPYCEYSACSQCIQKFLLSTPDSPHCMNCNKAWSRIFLAKQLTKRFLNVDYKRARENMLFELEKSLMPETVVYVEKEKERQMWKRKIDQNEMHAYEIRAEIRRILITDRHVREYVHERKKELLCLDLDNQLYAWYLKHPDGVEGNVHESKKFVKACCRPDCRGFLSTQWKCGICEKFMCSKCHEAKDDGHECNPDTVKTIDSMSNNEYKPCPKCSAIIFKIDGCNQMFCTNKTCRTAFDWKTGKIVIGRIHNPHYFEYIREHGARQREIGDIQCGGLPNAWDVADHYTRVYGKRWDNEALYVYNFLRKMIEFSEIALRPEEEQNVFDINKSSRVAYMMGNMSEDGFKSAIQQKNKNMEKRREIRMISTTVIQIMTDIFSRYKTDNLMPEIIAACRYVNNLYTDVSKAYGCVAPYISDINGSVTNVVR